MSDIATLRWLYPKNTAKWLQAELGCSPRQSHRILYEGRVAAHLRARLLALIDEAIAANERELRRLRRELGTERNAEMADQPPRMVGPVSAVASRSRDRAGEA